MKRYVVAVAALSLLAFPVHAFKLIKDDEAKLPAASRTPPSRAITRGPGIKLLAPAAASEPLTSPIKLKLAFEPHGGAKIDPASIKVIYLKASPVDLLDRVKHGVSEQGIELAGAEVPPGEHEIQVTVQDSEGRKSAHVVRLTVAK